MDMFINQLIQFCVNNSHKSSPFNSTHHVELYPQNGDRIVTIDSVTSLHRTPRRIRMLLSFSDCTSNDLLLIRFSVKFVQCSSCVVLADSQDIMAL